jgi:hypothetical protein
MFETRLGPDKTLNMKIKLSSVFRNFYQYFMGKPASGVSNMAFPRKKEWDEALRNL